MPARRATSHAVGLISLADLARAAGDGKSEVVKVSDLASTLSGIVRPRAAA